jgi:hypothetical protein
MAKFIGNAEEDTIINGNPDGATVFDAGSLTEVDFSLTESPNQTVIDPGSSGVEVADDDAILVQQTGAVIETNAQLLAGGAPSFEFDDLDPSIATVNSGGQVSWVSTGTGRILCKSPRLWKHKNVAVSRSSGQSTSVFNRYVAGSLAKYLTDTIDNAIAGKNFATNGPLFTSMDHVLSVYVRNASCWTALAGIDCTGISPWNSRSEQKQTFTLLHPRIAITSGDYYSPAQVGDRVRFVSSTNVVYERTIDSAFQNGLPGFTTEYFVRFSEALPDDIGIVKLFPLETWFDYLPNIPNSGGNLGYRIPGFGTDQQKKAYVEDLRAVGAPNASWWEPEDATRHLFHQVGWGVGGDSGSSKCLAAGTQLILVSLTSGINAMYSSNVTFIDACMNQLLGGATTTKFSLSGYTQF